jgi:hypothetical protein
VTTGERFVHAAVMYQFIPEETAVGGQSLVIVVLLELAQQSALEPALLVSGRERHRRHSLIDHGGALNIGLGAALRPYR